MASDPQCRPAGGSVSTDRQEMLDFVCRTAVAAGEAILKVYAEEFDVRHKTDKTPVTEADLAAERIIVDRLMSAFPDIPCVAEELCEVRGDAALLRPLLGDRPARRHPRVCRPERRVCGADCARRGRAAGTRRRARTGGRSDLHCMRSGHGYPPPPCWRPRADPCAYHAAGRARHRPQPLAREQPAARRVPRRTTRCASA